MLEHVLKCSKGEAQQTRKKDNEKSKKHTNIQSNKKTIKQTINQSKQTISKERKRKNPKEETLY